MFLVTSILHNLHYSAYLTDQQHSPFEQQRCFEARCDFDGFIAKLMDEEEAIGDVTSLMILSISRESK
jgi:hypothetical protein